MIDTLWPKIVEAFAFYGKKVRENPGPARRRLLQQRLDDGFSPAELVMAVHGYLWSHDGFDRMFENGLTSGHYFRPETVFKADGFEDRVERGDRPWTPRKHSSRAAERDQNELDERAADKARVLKERGLKLV